MFKNPVVAALVFLFLYVFVLGLFAPALVCVDGWASPSIGISGACSHHGGVDNSYNDFVIISGMILAVFVGIKIHRRNQSGLDNKFLDSADSFLTHLLKKFNRLICSIWNWCVRAVIKSNVLGFFERHPFIGLALTALPFLMFPILMLVAIVLGGFAAFNGADRSTDFLVPDIKDKF